MRLDSRFARVYSEAPRMGTTKKKQQYPRLEEYHMANRPPRGLQQRILALLAARPNQTVSQNGSSEACSERIAKRLSVTEKALLSELETMERDHLIRVTRDNDTQIIKHIQIAHGVDPAEWAMAEVQETEQPSIQIPENLDVRQLADSILLSALAAMESGDTLKAQQKVHEEEITDLKETNERLRSEVSHVKIERDTNIRAKKVAEEQAREQKNRADEALTQVAELEADIAALNEQIESLEQQVRTAVIGGNIVEDMDTRSRQQLLRAIQEQHRN